MSRLFAEFWCKQLAGKPAIYAGAQNPAQDFRKTKRQLGVVSTNDPDNERVIRKVLYPALKQGLRRVGQGPRVLLRAERRHRGHPVARPAPPS